ncbi:MAG: N-6 DNA methylase [Kordiimonadaceae bacterium]|jgi:hypothetical protein|nr:N-6 DNA methylase [Kordiimonadaceae bacterium]
MTNTPRERNKPATTRPFSAPTPPSTNEDLAFWRELLIADLTVTASEITMLAGKETPSAVNHWRKRKHNPFPPPVVGGRNPNYSLEKVLAWFETDKKISNPYAKLNGRFLWEKTVHAAFLSSYQKDRLQLRTYIAALIVLPQKYLNDQPEHFSGNGKTPHRGMIRGDLENKLLPSICHHLLNPLIDAETYGRIWLAYRYATATAQDWHSPNDGTIPGTLLDQALDTLSEATGVRSTSVSNRPMVDLITAIVGLHQSDHPQQVLDIACGEGTFLVDLHLHGPPNLTLNGIESDNTSAEIADLRLGLHGADESATHITRANAHLFQSESLVDIALVDPPKAGRNQRDQEAWATLARRTLKAGPNSRALAFCLAPGGATIVSPIEKNLEAVILLPARLNNETAAGLALKIFTEKDTICYEILVIDLTNIKIKNLTIGPNVTNPHGPEGSNSDLPLKEITQALSTWRRNKQINEDTPHIIQRIVRTNQLTNAEIRPEVITPVDLAPAVYRSAPLEHLEHNLLLNEFRFEAMSLKSPIQKTSYTKPPSATAAKDDPTKRLLEIFDSIGYQDPSTRFLADHHHELTELRDWLNQTLGDTTTGEAPPTPKQEET